MRKCGLAIAVKNARPEVKSEAHWITTHAAETRRRDAVEYILKAQGKWKKIVEAYISEKAGNGASNLALGISCLNFCNRRVP